MLAKKITYFFWGAALSSAWWGFVPLIKADKEWAVPLVLLTLASFFDWVYNIIESWED